MSPVSGWAGGLSTCRSPVLCSGARVVTSVGGVVSLWSVATGDVLCCGAAMSLQLSLFAVLAVTFAVALAALWLLLCRFLCFLDCLLSWYHFVHKVHMPCTIFSLGNP